MVLDPWKVLEVRRLLAADEISQRKISIEVGVSRGMVNAIANGHRQDYDVVRNDDMLELGPIERCKTCGGKVHMPCRLCAVRKMNMRFRR